MKVFSKQTFHVVWQRTESLLSTKTITKSFIKFIKFEVISNSEANRTYLGVVHPPAIAPEECAELAEREGRGVVEASGRLNGVAEGGGVGGVAESGGLSNTFVNLEILVLLRKAVPCLHRTPEARGRTQLHFRVRWTRRRQSFQEQLLRGVVVVARRSRHGLLAQAVFRRRPRRRWRPVWWRRARAVFF